MNGRGGVESGTCMKLPFDFMRESYSDMHMEIKVSLILVLHCCLFYCHSNYSDIHLDID
jgi:hypothetical protein